MQLSRIIEAIERLAPLNYQEEWDNSGLQVGFPNSEINKILVCLDVTEKIVDEAIEKGCQLIVSHHPLLFRPIKQVSDSAYQQRCIARAIQSGIAIYSAHTSLDNAPDGVNTKIAEIIGLENCSFLLPSMDCYSGSGLIGELPVAMSLEALLNSLKSRFSVESLRYCPGNAALIKRIALCGGSGAFLMSEARKAGAQCFITGEASYHDFFECEWLSLIELGHYQSEQYSIELLIDYFKEHLSEIEVIKTENNTNPIRYK